MTQCVEGAGAKPTLLVLASTYPRWAGDPEPAFVHELCRRLTRWFAVVAVVPDADGADPSGMLDDVEVVRYRYAPRQLQTLVHNGGIVANLRRSPWKWLLLPTFVAGQWWVALRLMRRRPVSVIHAHWLVPQGLVAWSLGRWRTVPYVVTSHGGDLFGLRGGLLTRIKRVVASAAGAMTVVSSAMVQEVRRLALRPNRLDVIPMGVDLRGRFRPDLRVERSASELLFVGRLVPKKGLDRLLDAMPVVLASKPDTFLTVVGFGPEEGALRARAQALGLGERVSFQGAIRQEDLPRLYQRAALFVSPFRQDRYGDQEGLPVAMMEALACGCPVIVGDVPGVRDLLGDADATCVVPDADVSGLADAVLYGLEHPREVRQRAGELIQATSVRVDWERIAAAYSELLLSLCASVHAPDSRSGQ